MDKIERYYNKFNEEKRLNTRHGQIEYRITMKYIHDYLNLRMQELGFVDKHELRILDIGAGTGRYSVALCEEGYSVTAVELVRYNLGILKQKNSRVHAMQGNALNLKKLQDNTFDLTLLFGPMYHLMTRQEKVQALAEAKRVTKPGGIIMVAYIMNEYAVVVYGIQENKLRESMQEHLLDEDFHTVPGEDSLYDFVRMEDIDELNREVGLKREKILSPDGPANYIRPFVNQLDEESYELFVRYQLKVCERPDLIGAGAHTVDILRKNE
ncbi:MAG: class I SAM-dependent methyltransferase [Wujia sp.]